MGNNICPYCGAHLDPGEHCDCRDEESLPEEQKESPAPASKQD